MKSLKPFDMDFSEDFSYEDDLRTSSFLENQIVATSRKIGCNIDEIITLAAEYSVASPYSSSMKY